jgi:hypothetical protein
MTDWFGRRLTLANHETSKGRVVACANADLHKEAVAILGKTWMRRYISTSISEALLFIGVGIWLGFALSRPRSS